MEELAALRKITPDEEHLIAELNHALQGPGGRKSSPGTSGSWPSRICPSPVEAERDTRGTRAEDAAARPAPRRRIGNLPLALPRIEVVVEPESLNCPCGCGPLHRIGEDRPERLDIVPAQLRVIVTIRPGYACRGCTDGVTEAPPPTHLIPGGLLTEATLAQVLVSNRGADAPPPRGPTSFRYIARARSWRAQVLICTAPCWPIGQAKAAFQLRPIADRLAEHLRRSGKLFLDETTAPVPDPGAGGTTKTGYLQALARDDRAWGGEAPPAVVCSQRPAVRARMPKPS